jgi:putative redox protein
MEANVKWNSKLTFTGVVRGHETIMDTTLLNGGLNRGPSPKEMLLNSISACAGMDIVYLLEKSDELLTLDINATADMTKTSPSYFSAVRLIFKLSGKVQKDSAITACESSMTKHCGVSLMLTKVCPVTYEVVLNGEKVFSGVSKFEEIQQKK